MSSANPRVSIVCIFYDAERFLAEALDSVLAQDFADWELLLVDDGSSDSSTGIALEYAAKPGKRIRYLDHPGHANRGMSASRNLGLAQGHGEFVAFIDADDVWRPSKLTDQVALLEGMPEVGMVCGAVNYWRSWSGGTDRLVPTGVPDTVSHAPQTALALYPLGQAHAPCPSDIMARRALVEAVGGFEEQFEGFYEDQAFFAKVYLATSVLFSREVWLDYRQHPDSSVSRTLRQGGYRQTRRRFLDWLAEYVSERGLSGEERIKEAIARAHEGVDRPLWARLARRMAGR